MRSQTEQTLAALDQAYGEASPDRYERDRRAEGEERVVGTKAATGAAAAAEHIQEAMQLARSIELHGVEAHLSAAATSLSLATDGEIGRRGRQGPPPPIAFQIAALVVGILDERTQRGDPPTQGELAEVTELTQSGQALLWGGKRSSNWQRTHDATDAAEHAPHAHHDLPPGHGGPGGTTQPGGGGGGRRGSPGGALPTQGATRGARSAPSGRYRPCKGGPRNKSLAKRRGQPTQRMCCGRDGNCATL